MTQQIERACPLTSDLRRWDRLFFHSMFNFISITLLNPRSKRKETHATPRSPLHLEPYCTPSSHPTALPLTTAVYESNQPSPTICCNRSRTIATIPYESATTVRIMIRSASSIMGIGSEGTEGCNTAISVEAGKCTNPARIGSCPTRM